MLRGPVATPTQAKNESNWSFLSLGTCGIDEYLKAHPSYDGRGTIIAILDDGVDPGIAGLLETSEGKRKFIDVQDFAGSGDLFWQSAQRQGDNLLFGGKQVLGGLDKLALHPVDDKYFYAVLSEKKYQNGLGDLNFNGRRDDNFGVVIFQDAKDHWSAVVDGNGDSSLVGEEILSTYKEHLNVYHLRAADGDSIHDGRYLTGAVNIFPNEKRINLYFADGGHGTHVAGIAGGHRIDGQTGFNGVAPGAEMIALKFADNTRDGVTVSGSMKRAYEYVIKVAQERGKPVIANMSFGIGSELEGRSVMDMWLDSLLDAHPEVTVCISAGNDGPGLSNIGLPGSARTVITSGAALPAETGRDLYGVKMAEAHIWDFSSRGAELAKPDIVSPGTAISTVPDYVLGDRYNGTSMSSPYTTGCCAILLSGMLQQFSSYQPIAYDVKRALQLSARHISGASIIDEGGGMINVVKAFEYLSDWQKKNTHPHEYKISVSVPNSIGKGTAAFYRNGIFPKNSERTVFTVTPVEHLGGKVREKILSFNAYDLKSSASWLEPVQSTIYHRGEGGLQVNVNYDPKQLQKPGVYCGKILGYPKGMANSAIPEFELWNTVVIPHYLSPENSYTSEIHDIKVKSGTLQREFFMIPAGAKGVKVSLNSRDLNSNADAVIINNDGRTFSSLRIKPTDDDEPASRVISGEELVAGVWEIVIKRGLGSDDEKESVVDLKVEAFPLEVRQQIIPSKMNGISAARVEITNTSVANLQVDRIVSEIRGYECILDTVITNSDVFEYHFKANPGDASASFDVNLERDDYNLFTDISLQILKPDGTAVFNGGFDLRDSRARVTFEKDDNTDYMLKFSGGLANPNHNHDFRLIIRERRSYDRTKTNENYDCKSSPTELLLYPAQTEYVDLLPHGKLPELSRGFSYYGDCSLHTTSGVIHLPMKF